jgi:BlaI family penicillinase repressor
MRKAGATLTGQELEIMKEVWKLKTATVRQVYEALLERRKIAYTTVMTMMNILEQKGFLKKRAGERAFVYAPSRPERQVIRAMVREFLDRVFNGAAEPLLVHLVEDEQLTARDLEEIRRTIRPAGGKPAGDKRAQ